MLPLAPLIFLSCLFFLFRFAVGTLINVTIDDTNPGGNSPSITYFPDGAWNLGADCSGCTARPDPSQMFDGTWHDGTFNPVPGSNNFPNQILTASVSFNGTAVYVFCALARTSTGPDGDSDMTFYIDGKSVGTFVKTAPGTTGYDYNVPVFSITSLSPGTHNLTIQNGHMNGKKSLVLLDSIVYTFDDGKDNFTSSSSSSSSSTSSSSSSSSQTQTSSSVAVSPTSASDASSSSKTNIGAIVGSAAAAALLVIALLVAAFFYCRRRLGSNSNRRLSIDPILPPTSGTVQCDSVSILQAGPSQPGYINRQPSSASGSGISVPASPAPLSPMKQMPSAPSSTSNASHYISTEMPTGTGGSQSQSQGQSTQSGKTHRTQRSASYITHDQSGWTATGEEGEYPDEAPPAYAFERAKSLKMVGEQKAGPLESRQPRTMNQ